MSISDGEDLGRMSIDQTETCGNTDAITLVAQIDLGLRQFSRCPSATRNDTQRMDAAIMRGWGNKMTKLIGIFTGKPEGYMPNAAPKPMVLPNPPEINIVQNPDIQHQMFSMSQLRTQILFSEDSERTSGFHSVTAAEVFAPWLAKFFLYVDMMDEHIDPGNAISTYAPDANSQDPGVNASNPR
jgi:hypothetical protein